MSCYILTYFKWGCYEESGYRSTFNCFKYVYENGKLFRFEGSKTKKVLTCLH